MKSLLKSRAVRWGSAALLCCVLSAAGLVKLVPEHHHPAAGFYDPLQKEPVSLDSPKPAPAAPPALSNRLVEYHMSVALQTETRSLQGSESVTWTNPGKQPVGELYFHLYPNAFESKKTTFLKESGGKLRSDEQKADGFGSMEVLAVKTPEGGDLLGRISYVRPDDGNENDRTLMKLTLPKPVMPGEKVTLSLDFAVRMPEVFARMGYKGDFYMAGQWFPKLAVYEPAGTRGRTDEGWNLHQYHGNSEFYADFGIFDVKIKVPSSYTVAATGFPTKPAAEKDGAKTYRFYADDVHDFAWAASPNFQYAEESFSAPNIPGLKIKLYLDPQHAPYKARYMQAAKKALARFSEWYGPYPYSTLSIVVPPEGAGGAAGMEYPTLITSWAASPGTPTLDLERVVVHEIGHQYWYGMVASNEFEEAWLDEGFTSYAEDKVMEREYGVKSDLALEAGYMTSPAPLLRNSWDYGSHAEYADNVYTRAKLVLRAIEAEIGSDQMAKVMRTYFDKWKFRHPSTRDFQTVLESVTKKSWDPFFSQFVYGSQMVDYAVDSIRVRETAKDGRTVYDNEVVISQQGAPYPAVPVRFYFADGSHLDKVWDSQGSRVVYTVTHPSPVVRVLIDPERTLLLENQHINNYRNASIDPRWSARWNGGIVKLIESLFGSVAW
ncbi:hypothetical protein J31TS4_35920 [Paenibacillus sp. J31TS4]|uniref:M1 family metallopeptidase n=1 Tax=Paenibacillus sp. J31TS4 TaxID=2807195 RepID=UPI001B0B6776|nr:M1 family metallopeptidase [Paenibacillus sp. J31TS4]GIP40312.1 hypothetical protein J31TS4_35920 [Paenibacillus sp. J31TS4]